MKKKDFENEVRYEVLMYQVKKMLKSGLITEDEFRTIDQTFRQKYKPFTGGLLIYRELVCKEYDNED